MPNITVWTKQHESVLETLERCGRYTARREFVKYDLGEEHAPLVLEVYDWLVQHLPPSPLRPEDAELPVWVSFERSATMLKSPGTVILELSVDPGLVMGINIAKWGAMLNYSYLPESERDAREHRRLLEDYGVSDARAFMTPFYPQIKRGILNSWPRLFDDSVSLGSDAQYGLLWEVRKSWLVRVIQ